MPAQPTWPPRGDDRPGIVASRLNPIDESAVIEYATSMMLKAKDVAAERWWDVWIAIFSIILVTVVAGRLWITEWTRDLYILVFLTILAALTGLALGYSRFSPLVAAVFSACYGFFSMAWLFGMTVNLDLTWRERIIQHLGWRLQIAIEQFSANQAVTDPILFLVIMAVLLWIMASTAPFIIIRQGSVWPVLIPLGITLLVVSHYDQNLSRNARFLMTFIFFTLLIVGRMNFLRHSRKWRQEGINTTPESLADLTRTLVLLTLALVVLAWIIPITPQQRGRYAQWWNQITEPWDQFRERFADILVLDTATETTVVTSFGDDLGLGTGTPISEEVVFTVTVNESPPASYRNYWFTRSYDRFQDGVWSSSPGLNNTLQFPDTFDIPYPQWEGWQPAAYTFTLQTGRLSNLYVTGMPTWINRPVETTMLSLSEGEADLVALLADPVLFFGETYQVETLTSRPTASELRQTSTDYPQWLDRYLQLPDDFSPEVAALAAQFGLGDDHPYDIAAEITRYLRINIEYARTIPPVPSGADPIEWFLFEEQAGFCNYYAAAQVLMLRSLGIPARFVVGYAEGEYDSETQTYTVRKLDSHAWPEVYFTDYGWVPFEPTASQPALILPAGVSRTDRDPQSPERTDTPIRDDLIDDPLAQLDEAELEEAIDSEVLGPRVEGTRVAWIMLVLFLVVLASAIFILQRPELLQIDIDPLPVILARWLTERGKAVPDWLNRWSYLSQMSAAERAYRRLCRSIQLLGLPLDPAHTPAERAQTLANMIPQAYQPALEVVSEYHLDKFSNHYINEAIAKSAGLKVLGLAWKARLRRILNPRKV